METKHVYLFICLETRWCARRVLEDVVWATQRRQELEFTQYTVGQRTCTSRPWIRQIRAVGPSGKLQRPALPCGVSKEEGGRRWERILQTNAPGLPSPHHEIARGRAVRGGGMEVLLAVPA